ncbi:hypothetical protein C0995_005171, partial [Termitomyces sp. Mi166
MSKRKETVELQATMAPKTPMAGPSCLISEPMVLIPGTQKSVSKVPVVSATPVAGPSAISTSKIIAATPAPKPVPITSTGKPAIKGGSVIKNSFM